MDTGLFGEAGSDYYRGELVVDFQNEQYDSLELTFDAEDNKKIRKCSIPPRTKDEPLKYSFVFTYYDMEGEEHEIKGEKTGKLLMIPKPKAAE